MEQEVAGYALLAGPGERGWVNVIRFVNRMRGSNRFQVLQVIESADLSRGTFVVPVTSALDPVPSRRIPAEFVEREAANAGIGIQRLGPDTAFIARPYTVVRVGLYGGGGAPFNHAGILSACGFPVEFLSDADIRAGALKQVDVFLMPGGGERAMFGQIEPLGEAGCRAIADWVREGGMYIGCCAGSYDCIVNDGEFLAACPAQRGLQIINARPWRGAEAVGFLGLQSPGVGVVRVTNARPDHPVMYGMPEEFSIVHYNGPVLDPDIPRTIEGASAAAGLASFAGPTERFTPAERFAGGEAADDSTYLVQAVNAGRFSITAGEIGLGRVVAFGSHPEFGFDLAMTEWGEPARMFVNAVLWQSSLGHGIHTLGLPSKSRTIGCPPGHSLTEVQSATGDLLQAAQSLRERSIEPAPSWLAPSYAMSVFGMPPAAIWHQALDDISSFAGEIGCIAGQLQREIPERLRDVDGLALARRVDMIGTIDRWTLDERPPEWGQDGGYQGVRALLRTATRMCERALANWEIELGPPGGPYDYFGENPFHQVGGSYLAASGCAAGAVHLMRGLRAQWEMLDDLERDVESLRATVVITEMVKVATR